jgi:hypothetical protein
MAGNLEWKFMISDLESPATTKQPGNIAANQFTLFLARLRMYNHAPLETQISNPILST